MPPARGHEAQGGSTWDPEGAWTWLDDVISQSKYYANHPTGKIGDDRRQYNKKPGKHPKYSTDQHRAAWRRKQAARKRRAAGGSAGGGVGSSSSESFGIPTAAGPGLPPFGNASMRRVEAIVNSMIADAGKEYRHGNEDLKKQQLADLMRNARTQVSYDTGIQALKAGNTFMNQQAQQQNADLAQAQLDARQRIEQAVNAQGAGLGTPTLSGTVAAADDNAAVTETGADLQQSLQSDNAFMNAMRAASAQGAIENARGLRGAYQQAMQQNNRALADIKAKRALTRLEVEKQIKDMHIADRLARASYSNSGQDILTKRAGRASTAAELRMKKQALKADKASRAIEKQKSIALEVLYGKTQDLKSVMRDAEGNPVTVTRTTNVGAPSNLNEAIAMLAAAGYTGKKWQNIAKQIMNERAQQTIQEGRDQFVGMFGGFG